MVRPHELHERPPGRRPEHPPRGPDFEATHTEIIELIERKFRELNHRLDDIETRIR